jgi:hypothetical protein
MKSKHLKLLCSGLVLLAISCSTEELEKEINTQNKIDAVNSTAKYAATQISGVGYFANPEDCNYEAQEADFALLLTGDLEGCLHVYVDDYNCSPSGTYRESGREYFVGTYKGEEGTFWTSYKFEAKYEGCSEEGFFLGAEIFGRCQHPIKKGSGTGVFENVIGRLDFKDNVETGEFPYKGHLIYN